jgi:hypothetical protein
VLDWLAAQQPDVLVLQETKLTDDKFPHAEIEAAGWQRAVVRPEDLQRRGAAVRAPSGGRGAQHPRLCRRQARVIAATVGGVRVVGAYFPNGQAPGSDKFAYKMQLAASAARLAARPSWPPPGSGADGRLQHRPDDRDVYDPVAWAGQIHCTDEERAHFQGLRRRWACGAITVSQWQRFSSCRTLPGKSKPTEMLRAPRRTGAWPPRPVPGALLQEVARQQGNVLAPLAQRRQRSRMTFSGGRGLRGTGLLAHALLEVLVRRGDDAHVGLDRLNGRRRGRTAVGQHAQQPRLQLGRHVADLVEEQRAALGLLEAAAALRLPRR